MEKPSSLAPWQWALVGSIGTVILLLAGVGAYSLVSEKEVVSSTANVVSDNAKKTHKKLIGQWETDMQGEKVVLVFTPDKRFITWGKGETEAKEGNYKVNVDTTPMQIDLGELEGNFIPAIIELISKNEIQLQFPTGFEGELLRPKNFDENALVLKKISDSAELPSNLEILSFAQNANQQMNIAIRNQT